MLKRRLKEEFKNAIHKLILLDYDGTLVNYCLKPEDAVPSKEVINVLTKLSGKTNTKVVIITGRRSRDIDKLLGHLPIDIVAEHGAMIKESGVWKNLIIDEGVWKNEIRNLLNKYTLLCAGSFIEEKEFSFAWHYRMSDNLAGFTHSRKLIDELKNNVQKYSLKIMDGNKVVEIMNSYSDKGVAAQLLLKENKYDCVIAIGDDKTDEEMFKVLSDIKNCFTIKVGEGATFAKHKIENVEKVLSLLKQF